MKRIKVDKAKEVRRAARAVIGEPSRGRKRGPHRAERTPASKMWTAEEVDAALNESETGLRYDACPKCAARAVNICNRAGVITWWYCEAECGWQVEV